MKKIVSFVAFGALAVFPLACADDTPTAPDGPPVAPSLSRSGETGFEFADHYVIGYGGQGITSEVREAVEEMGGSIYREWTDIGYGVVGGISEDDADELRMMDGVGSVSRDLVLQWVPPAEEFALEAVEAPTAETDQSGAFFFDVFQWNMRQIDADDAWLTTNQGDGVTVAILDTGIDPFQLDLSGGKVDVSRSTSVLSSFTICDLFVPDRTTFFDFNFHGTFVGGLASGNGLGMASVAPDATLIGVKVLSCLGSGSFADVIAGIFHATNVGADVINMSLGALIPTDVDNEELEEGIEALIDALEAAIDFATDNGVSVYASAGNEGLNFDDLPGEGNCFPPSSGFGPGSCDDLEVIHIPSMLDDVASVGATGPINQMNFDQRAGYSNFGEAGVDVMAPGGQSTADIRDGILSACSSFSLFFPGCAPGNFYLLGGTGTSFAAPHGAGAAAVAIGDGEDAECVLDGADQISGTNDTFGSGRVNVLGAAACERVWLADD